MPGGMRVISPRGRTQLRIIALVVLVCAIAGCGNPGVVGKWRMSGASNAIVWEFFSNGLVVVGNVRGKYTFGDQDRIKIETPYATSVYQLEISGDHMMLQESGGPKLEFARVRETRP